MSFITFKKLTVALLALITLLCCTKPYNPKVISSPNKYLVVEGVINSGSDSTKIKLSYSVSLKSKVTVNPVLGAIAIVESNQGGTYPLTDIYNNGTYCSAPMGLSASQQYRLRVTTADGIVYLSDFIAVKPTPSIDSVNYVLKGDKMYINVNTHDATNNTRYYRYEYGETWQFNAKYVSVYVVDSTTNRIVQRTPIQQVFHCFGHDSSTNVLLANTTKLAKDIVYQNPLINFSIHSEKIETKYSILVKQYALTGDAYTFYQNIQKTTEQLGSIFDSQPSQVEGNIHCVTDPNQPVIGYLTVTNPQSVRIFIPNSVLPGAFTPVDYPYDCGDQMSTIDGIHDIQDDLINPPRENIITSAIFDGFGNIIGYKFTTIVCGDCTIRGTTPTPPYWK